MILAYKKNHLEALALRESLSDWVSAGVIDKESAVTMVAKYPCPFYSPNFFIRIGLFIFGYVCVSAVFGIFFLVTNIGSSNSKNPFLASLMVFGFGAILVLEQLIRREKPFFGAGLEEAVLYSAVGSILSGVALWMEFSDGHHFQFSLLAAGVLTFTALRYIDRLLAAFAMAAGFYACFDLSLKSGTLGRNLLPFLMLAISGIIIWTTGIGLKKPALRYWSPVWKAVRFLALLTGYLSCNYLIVREISHAFLGMALAPGENIPFASVFYGFTALLPPFYLAVGLFKKNRIFFHAGLVTFAIAIGTYKFYHRFIPLELGFSLAGVALIGVAWSLLKYFVTSKHGISVKPETYSAGGKNGAGVLKAESLVSLTGLGGKNAPGQSPSEPSLPPSPSGSGGGFGGGGASGTF